MSNRKVKTNKKTQSKMMEAHPKIQVVFFFFNGLNTLDKKHKLARQGGSHL